MKKVLIVTFQRKSEELSSQPRVPKVKPTVTKVGKMLVMTMVMVIMMMSMIIILILSIIIHDDDDDDDMQPVKD